MKCYSLGLLNKDNRHSIPSLSYLIFILGVFLICTLGLFVYYQINYDYSRTVEENSKETMNLAKAFEEHVRRIVATTDNNLLYLKQVYERDDGASPAFISYWEHLASSPYLSQIQFINDRGMIVKSAGDTSFLIQMNQEFLFKHQIIDNQEFYISRTVKELATGKAVIPFSRSVYKKDGSFGGVICIFLKEDYILSFYQKIDLGQNQFIALNGKDGFSRTRQTNNKIESGQDMRNGGLWKQLATGKLRGTYMATNIDGVHRITSYRVMKDYPLIIAVGKSTSVALSSFEKRKLIYIISAIFASLSIIAYCRLLICGYAKQHAYNLELSRLGRLNLVGEMAAGIGHEVRNPLTTVKGYLQWFLRKDSFADYKGQLTTMIEEIERANSIITEFLSLAKNKAVQLAPRNINEVLNLLFPLLQMDAYQSGYIIKMEQGDVPDILIDESQFRQMLLNLVHNGFESMEAGNTLTIKTYREKNTVVLAVCDTGKGIPENILDKLGTPFVTTKDNGTGLGLPVCFRIAERHNAKIDIKTSEAGTIFFIKFRLAQI